MIYQILDKVKWVFVANSKTFLQNIRETRVRKGFSRKGFSPKQPGVGRILNQGRLKGGRRQTDGQRLIKETDM